MTKLFRFPKPSSSGRSLSGRSLSGRSGRAAWALVVVGAQDIAPGLRRVSLIGECLAGYRFRPGQDVVVSLPGGVHRHYPLHGFDAAELRLDIDVPLDGASRWAATARIGDPVLAEGPRNRAADWRTLTGDLPRLRGRRRISGWARA